MWSIFAALKRNCNYCSESETRKALIILQLTAAVHEAVDFPPSRCPERVVALQQNMCDHQYVAKYDIKWTNM